MKFLLFCSLFFFAVNHSFTQENDSDTLNTFSPRSNGYFYIDGIKVRGSRNIPAKSDLEEVSVITGGLPVNFGDCYYGCFIRIDSKPKTTIKISDKEQKMATE